MTISDSKAKYVVRSDPFPHVLIAPVFKTAVAGEFLSLLEDVLWEYREESFYRFMVPARNCINELILHEIKPQRFQCLLEKALHCKLETLGRIGIHRYGPSCGIGPHTDAPCREVRLVISLNTRWNPDQGGVWILARDSNLNTCRTLLPSMNNTAFAFATGATSFHALSTCEEGTFYNIVVRFARG
jgi:hypothetical protein